MKVKFIAILGLTASLFFAACGGSDSANTNANNTNMAAPAGTPIVANTNPALKTNIEAELKKKGFNNVTVDTSTTPATLRGTYPKGRLAEVIQTAQQANEMKPLQNQMTEEN